MSSMNQTVTGMEPDALPQCLISGRPFGGSASMAQTGGRPEPENICVRRGGREGRQG